MPQDFHVSRLRASYVLILFWLATMFSYLDRQVLAVLMEPIKAEFSLSDTQLGLLGGFAFGSFYAVLGLPIALMVDRLNRRNILTASIFFWSLMTSACGLVTSFGGLFAARACVAVGEAGGAPSIASLVSDYFPPEKRARAFSALIMAIPVSIMIGYTLGGLLNQLYGWKMAFILIGSPGIALSGVIFFTIREPLRGRSEKRIDITEAPSLWNSLRFLLRQRAYVFMVIAGSLVSVGNWGAGIWTPSYLIRLHELDIAEAGAIVGLVWGTAGIIGSLFGGWLTDTLALRTGDQRWYFGVCTLALLVTLPLAAGTYFTDNLQTTCIFMWLQVFFMHMYGGPQSAMLQALSGLRMRGMSVSFFNFINNLIAVGIGPLFVGMVSDFYGVEAGASAIRYALFSVIVVGYGGAAAFFAFGLPTLRQDLDLARKS
ncbi:MFS transporter [Emcibacter sp.]|uniref:spinster family MFS transporter n=1 Tax=Emcibacter sp. TaxID=1979954 RepID=UPI002AA8DE7C|nr:MFS transporter [Emcibacter sp.]